MLAPRLALPSRHKGGGIVARIVFLHGLESQVDADLVPTGRKAQHLRDRYGAETVALDTREAQKRQRQMGNYDFSYPFDGYDDAFALPMQRARDALGQDTQLVIGSSFGGAVLLRLLHETPGWRGPAIFLAGAGVKLTPHDSLPTGSRCILIHGTGDKVVPPADSRLLANSSPSAQLVLVEDGHRLSSVVSEGTLDEAIERLL